MRGSNEAQTLLLLAKIASGIHTLNKDPKALESLIIKASTASEEEQKNLDEAKRTISKAEAAKAELAQLDAYRDSLAQRKIALDAKEAEQDKKALSIKGLEVSLAAVAQAHTVKEKSLEMDKAALDKALLKLVDEKKALDLRTEAIATQEADLKARAKQIQKLAS